MHWFYQERMWLCEVILLKYNFYRIVQPGRIGASGPDALLRAEEDEILDSELV